MMKKCKTYSKKAVSLLLTLVMLLSVFPLTIISTEAASNEKTIYDYLTKTMKLNSAAACGVLANLEKESSFNPKSSYKESGGFISYGICQWNRGRLDNLKSYCSKNKYDYTTLNGQLHFLEYELKNSYKSVYNKLTSVPNTAQGAYDAGYKWCYSYEVPANYPNVSVTRGNLAKNIYWKKYGTGSSSSSSSSSSTSTSTSSTGSRQKALDYMYSMATIKWTAGANFTTTKGGSWVKGRTYYGIPYSQNTKAQISLATFKNKLSSNGTISSDIGQNDCSYAVTLAWRQVDSNSPISWTGGITPGSTNFPKVGSYTYSSNTATTCTNNGKTKMFAAYDCLQPGDALLRRYTTTVNGKSVTYGHIIMVVSVDKKNQKITIIHQSGGDKHYDTSSKKTTSGTRNSSWGVNEVRTYSSFYNDRYIPITSKALAKESYVDYTVKATGASDQKNTSAKINGNISPSASVKSWGYKIGTSSSSLTEKKTAEDWSSSPKSKGNVSTTISKFGGKDLEPGKTYYYQIFAVIGSKTYYSSTAKFTTTKTAPGTTTLTMDSKYSNIGISDQVQLSWKAASNTSNYVVRLYDSNGAEVKNSGNIPGTNFTCPSDWFTTPGTYYAALSAVNVVSTVNMTERKEITVHDDVTVSFYNDVNTAYSNPDDYDPDVERTLIETKTVHYGHEAVAPATPTTHGYVFKGWNKSFTSCKENMDVVTNYVLDTFTVKFVDGLSNEVLDTKKVSYRQSAEALAPQTNDRDGYHFVSWSVDLTSITDNVTATAVYQWENEAYSANTTINSVTRDNTKKGYNVSVTVNNRYDATEITEGRLVIALTSEDGLQLTTTESSAFSIPANGNKTINLFVPYDALAYGLTVYTLNSYNDGATIASPKSIEIDNSDAWSQWIPYTDDSLLPVIGVNNVSNVETKTETTPDVTQYRYKTKSTTTSYATSLSGYTQNGYTLVDKSTGSIRYISSWPSGFNKSNSLYTKYNKSPKSAVDNATQKITIDSTANDGYIYWHWCRGTYSDGPINRKINSAKTSEFKTFHAFESSTSKSYNSSAVAYQYSHASTCKDTYWWFGSNPGKSGLLTIKKQTYTTYNKLYNYYKWSDWSGWSTTPRTADANTQVETQSIPGTTTKYYRFKTSEKVTAPETIPEQNIETISGTVSPELSGKKATVFIYKYAQASDYTNEFIAETVIGSNGEVVVNDVKLREAPSIKSGDYTIAVSVEGNSNMIEIGTIKAPKPTYKVNYYAYRDNDTIANSDPEDKGELLYTVEVEQGGTAVGPDTDDTTIASKLVPGEGYRFTNWNQSTVNVQDNLDVYPEYEKETYVVVTVDWGSQEVTLKEYEYGDVVDIPAAEEVAGKIVTWDTKDLREKVVDLGDGTTSTEYTVYKHAVVTTSYVDEVYTTKFVKPGVITTGLPADDPDEGEDHIDDPVPPVDDEDILQDSDNTLDDKIDIPTEEEYPDYIFYGWRNANTGEYLIDTSAAESGTYYPVYEFAESVETPIADVKTSEYTEAQTLTLSCATETAVIYYTTDGTDPATSDTSVEYTEPITLSKSCQLNFCAMAMGMNNSVNVTELYAINTSGVAYHIVSVTSNLPNDSDMVYQALIRDMKTFDKSAFTDVEGYTYNGVFFDKDGTEEFYGDELVTESMDLFAIYTPNKYTATFVDSDGSLLDTVQADYLCEATPPAVNAPEGYVFTGWNSNEYVSITKDVTITAQYCLESEYATIQLNRTSININSGHSVVLRYTVTPVELSDTSITWETSNPLVAIVDSDGKVSLFGVGTAVISATVDSTGSKSSCAFTVTENYDENIVLSRNSVLDIDSNGYLRRVVSGSNTVAELKDQFLNEELSFYDINDQLLSDSDLVGTGAIIRLFDGESELDAMLVIMTGDFDGNGKVQTRDVSMMSQCVLELRDPTDPQVLAVDVNGDGDVNVRDCAMISRYLAGKEDIK